MGSSLSDMGRLSKVLSRGVGRPVAAVWSPYFRGLRGSTGETSEEAVDNLGERQWQLGPGS